ncbi:MAG TPA: ubiquinol-cytochrome c reductase iron-sulfur subunit [Gemmatimonadales bacterium]|nr:ubiquinol-cytochrome c reductase iron-sulfur subunit [Gemmatimonadales bacterium]
MMKRREFVELAASTVAAAALPGCASLVATAVVPVDGRIRLVVRNYPRLEQAGGYLKLRAATDGALLYVLALGGDEYVVVSPICTHLQCTVNIEGERLVCPCHGSTFDRAGRVLRGPAERPLARFPARLTPEGELVIEYRGAA